MKKWFLGTLSQTIRKPAPSRTSAKQSDYICSLTCRDIDEWVRACSMRAVPVTPRWRVKSQFCFVFLYLSLNSWNTRRETQVQTKLEQPPWKTGQHQTPETRPQLQTSRKKRSWTPQETMAMRRCRNRSSDLTQGGRWWWWSVLLF
jgi:hypothetical protein